MAFDKKYRGKVTLENLNDCLMYTGYMLPENELQLAKFNKLYEDYKFELNESKIDVRSIIDGTLSCNVKKISIINFKEDSEFSKLSMVARKGEEELPQHIIDKMMKKHDSKNDDQE